MMRAAINQDLLQSMLTKMRSHYSFRGDLDFCMQLIDSAASCDLSDRVILSEDGALLKMPTPRLDVPEPPKDFHAETVAIVPEPVNIQGDWHEPLDSQLFRFLLVLLGEGTAECSHVFFGMQRTCLGL